MKQLSEYLIFIRKKEKQCPSGTFSRCHQKHVNSIYGEASGWPNHSSGKPTSGPLAHAIGPTTEMPAVTLLLHTDIHSCLLSCSTKDVFLAVNVFKTSLSAHFFPDGKSWRFYFRITFILRLGKQVLLLFCGLCYHGGGAKNFLNMAHVFFLYERFLEFLTKKANLWCVSCP